MHPLIIRDSPGRCPVCGMDLVPVEKDQYQNKNILIINYSQINLAGIKLNIPSNAASISNDKKYIGRLEINPNLVWHVSAPFSGRVEKLYVKEPGVKIKKGQPLYTLYSEEIALLAGEYSVNRDQALKSPDDSLTVRINKALSEKLKLYGLDRNYIKRLSTLSDIAYVTFYAEKDGAAAYINTQEGALLEKGTPVMRIENYSGLWGIAEVYSKDIGNVHIGMPAYVKLENISGRDPVKTSIDFISPAIKEGSQAVKIRVQVSNKDEKLRPGQSISIILSSSLADNRIITIPVNAVIRDQSGSHVWIQKTPNYFEPRKVVLGEENAESVQILQGLSLRDSIVTEGAYLLYSEYVLKKNKTPF